MTDPQYPPTGDGTTLPAVPETYTYAEGAPAPPLADTGVDLYRLFGVAAALVIFGLVVALVVGRLIRGVDR